MIFRSTFDRLWRKGISFTGLHGERYRVRRAFAASLDMAVRGKSKSLKSKDKYVAMIVLELEFFSRHFHHMIYRSTQTYFNLKRDRATHTILTFVIRIIRLTLDPRWTHQQQIP